jgi:hypothetical protein
LNHITFLKRPSNEEKDLYERDLDDDEESDSEDSNSEDGNENEDGEEDEIEFEGVISSKNLAIEQLSAFCAKYIKRKKNNTNKDPLKVKANTTTSNKKKTKQTPSSKQTNETLAGDLAGTSNEKQKKYNSANNSKVANQPRVIPVSDENETNQTKRTLRSNRNRQIIANHLNNSNK